MADDGRILKVPNHIFNNYFDCFDWFLIAYFSIIDNEETTDESPQAKSGHHPHFDRAVMRSRRKSVSFAVYKVNADTMQFDIEHKSVLLGNLSGRVRLAFDS